jgi:Wzt C-terminal domain
VINEFHYKSQNEIKKDKIREVRIIRSDLNNNSSFTFDDVIKVNIIANHTSKNKDIHVGLAVLDKWHQKIFTDTYKLSNEQLNSLSSEYIVNIPSRTLLAGIYYFDVALFIPRSINFDYVSDACVIEIEDLNSELSIYNGGDIGNVMVKCKWEVIP